MADAGMRMLQKRGVKINLKTPVIFFFLISMSEWKSGRRLKKMAKEKIIPPFNALPRLKGQPHLSELMKELMTYRTIINPKQIELSIFWAFDR
jgi:hypothetical protein